MEKKGIIPTVLILFPFIKSIEKLVTWLIKDNPEEKEKKLLTQLRSMREFCVRRILFWAENLCFWFQRCCGMQKIVAAINSI